MDYFEYPYYDPELSDPISRTLGPGDYESAYGRFIWRDKREFFYAILGFMISYGTIFRFPVLIYRFGGSYFVAYTIVTILVGYAPLFLELAVGQYHNRGPYNIYRVCPIFEGIAISMILWCLIVAFYYMIIVAFSFYIIFHSFSSHPPWLYCPKEMTSANDTCYNISTKLHHTVAARYFWDTHIENSSEEGRKWKFNYQLAICSVTSWLIICVFLIRGLHKYRKISRITFTFPFIILLISVIISTTHQGSEDGFRYFFAVDANILTKPEIWRYAIHDTLFTFGSGTGCLMILGSYNNFRSKGLRKTVVILVIVVYLINIFYGMVVCMYMGNKAQHLNITIHKLVNSTAEEGISIEAILILYMEMIGFSAVPQLWMVAFNVLIIFVGFNAVVILLEVPHRTLADNCSFKTNKILMWMFYSCAFCGLSLVTCMEGGPYMLHSLDTYICGKALIHIEIMSFVCLIYFYGCRTLSLDIKFMLNYPPSIYTRLVWIVLPIIMTTFVMWTWARVNFSVTENLLGFLLLIIILVPIFAMAIYNTLSFFIDKKQTFLLKPRPECGPINQINYDMRENFNTVSSDDELDTSTRRRILNIFRV